MTFRIAITRDDVRYERTTDIDFLDLWYRWLDKPVDQHERRLADARMYASARPIEPDDEVAREMLRQDGRTYGRGHKKDCDCYRCQNERAAYELGADLQTSLLRKRVAVLSIALWTDPNRASDVLKRFHAAHAHFQVIAQAGIATEQAGYLAKTYDLASAILWRRMRHYAETRHEHVRVKPRSSPPTIGRGGDVEVYVCEECERMGVEHDA